jgi:hypothetical protein
VNSKYQQLYFLGLNQINLNCYDLLNNELSWSESQVMELPFHHPGSLFFLDKEIYVSFKQGFIRGYDQFGNIFFATEYTQATEPARLFKLNDIIAADLKEKSGHKRFITTYYAASGMLKYQYETNFEVVEFFRLDDENVYVLANEEDESNIYIYDIDDSKLLLFHEFPYGKILSGTSIDDNNIMIGCEEGVFWLRYNFSSLTQFIDHISANFLSFEEIGNFLIVSDDHTFGFYSFPGAVPKGDFEMEDKILNVHLLYNK